MTAALSCQIKHKEDTMKKSVCFFLCLNMMITFSFALQETWFNVGFAYGNSIDVHPNQVALSNGYTGSSGLTTSMYGFWDMQNIGVFAAFSGTNLVVTSVPNEINNYEALQAEGLIGVGFRHPISKRLTLVYSGGLDFLYERLNYRGVGNEVFKGQASNMGIGGDVGLKFDITPEVGLRIGSLVSYHFVNHTRIDGQTFYGSEWRLNSRFGIQPYLTFGFNSYSQERRRSDFGDERLGKP
jgi:hypothetical protein